jgi:NADPH2:quinone reductase
VILEGKIKVEIRHVYPLAEAAEARRDLEGRRTVGSIVMIP